MNWNPLAKWIIIFGIALVILGLLWQFGSRFLPFLGRLPGDIVIDRDNFHITIPITTMIIVSIVLTLLLNLIARLFNNR